MVLVYLVFVYKRELLLASLLDVRYELRIR